MIAYVYGLGWQKICKAQRRKGLRVRLVVSENTVQCFDQILNLRLYSISTATTCGLRAYTYEEKIEISALKGKL